ncbi:MAG TPA: SDR family oxidoreductase [Polyangiaceae bacterium]|jgi:NAD(P)-dependent dehydrogenase (short-subunit alcohol dehydrogenase family)
MQIETKGAAVIVTGGTKGVGRGIAVRFLEAGANVVVCGRSLPAEPVVSPSGRAAIAVAADVREVEAVERVVARAMEAYGRIDVLVNNAGGSPAADAATVSPRFSASIIQLNLVAPLVFAQKANQVMQAQATGGSIVNIASVSGLRPSPGTAAYGAAKAGLLNLTESLAVEWAPKVRVNAIAAGPLKTEKSTLHYGDDAGLARVAATIPMGRLGEPEDVADLCLVLVSPLCRYVTGATIALHGGGERPAFLDAAAGKR